MGFVAPYHVRMYERRLDSNTAPWVTLKAPKGPSAPQDPLKAVYDSAGRNLAIPQLPVSDHDLGSRSLSSSEIIVPATTDQFKAQSTSHPFFPHPSSAFHEAVF